MKNMQPVRLDGQRDDLTRFEGSLLGGADSDASLTETGVDVLLRAYIANHLHLGL